MPLIGRELLSRGYLLFCYTSSVMTITVITANFDQLTPGTKLQLL